MTKIMDKKYLPIRIGFWSIATLFMLCSAIYQYVNRNIPWTIFSVIFLMFDLYFLIAYIEMLDD